MKRFLILSGKVGGFTFQRMVTNDASGNEEVLPNDKQQKSNRPTKE